MTSSKSNSWFSRAVMVLFVLLISTGVASAGRKRLVVLEFEGDNAEKLQKSFVKFLKKSHTVISMKKWSSAADELNASKLSEKNIKKVAKKLKIDGVISANVEKRRDEYIIRIKLRSGASGGFVGNQVNIKAGGTKLDKSAKSDIEDELFGQIDDLEAVRAGGGGGDEEEEEEEDKPKPGKKDKGDEEEEEEEDKPSKFGGKFTKNGKNGKDEEKPAKKDEEDKPAKVSKKDEEDKPKKDTKKDDEERAALATKKDKKDKQDDEEEDRPKRESKRKKVAKADDEEEEIEEEFEPGPSMERAVALSPGNRAVDGTVGLSFSMRRLSFTYDPTIGTRPPGYKGKPVPGAMFDAAVYPMAFGHNETGMLKNLGVTGMYDKVLIIKSKDMAGNELITEQARFAIGAVFRFPFGSGANAPVVGARLRYGKKSFKIENNPALPNVNYTVIDPGVFFRLPIGQKIVINANAAFMVIPKAGQITKADQYGGATVSGLDASAGFDYQLIGAIFARASVNFETIGFKFKGSGMRTDGGKVGGARDSYFGATISAGYLF